MPHRTLPLLALLACVPSIDDVDTDGDGLADRLEQQIGTDPASADTDGDGLLDGFEVDSGLDPLSADSDGDGYLDSHELMEDTDPLDPGSRIFVGGMPMWPYNPNKGQLIEPGFTVDRPGEVVPRLRFTDQYGDTVDLYNFANTGKPLLIVMIADWCEGCSDEIGKLFEGSPSGLDTIPGLDCIAPALAAGDIQLITVIDSGGVDFSVPPTDADRDRHLASYPRPKHPVVLDSSWAYRNWGGAESRPNIPGMTWIDTDTMTVVASRMGGIYTIVNLCDALEE